MLAAAGWTAAARAAVVSVIVVADETCAPQVQAVIAEQLAGLATGVTFSCAGPVAADAEEPFRATPASAGRVQLWLDVSAPTEARLTVGDGGDRFVVRRVPLARGLDEVGREEIGQIVRSAVMAVQAGPSETLSRAEARVAVSSWPSRSSPTGSALPPGADSHRPSLATPLATSSATSPRPAGAMSSRRSPTGDEGSRWRGSLELGPAASLRAFSTALPLVGEVGLLATVSAASGASLWLEGAYRLPAQARTPSVGVEIRALAVRGGVALSLGATGRLAFRVGLGGGVERSSFSPRSTGGDVDLAPGESFLLVTGRALAGAELLVAAHLGIGLTAFCDGQATDVHYDLRGVDGVAQRVLTPFRLQPGIALSVSGRL